MTQGIYVILVIHKFFFIHRYEGGMSLVDCFDLLVFTLNGSEVSFFVDIIWREGVSKHLMTYKF